MYEQRILTGVLNFKTLCAIYIFRNFRFSKILNFLFFWIFFTFFNILFINYNKYNIPSFLLAVYDNKTSFSFDLLRLQQAHVVEHLDLSKTQQGIEYHSSLFFTVSFCFFSSYVFQATFKRRNSYRHFKKLLYLNYLYKFSGIFVRIYLRRSVEFWQN